LRGANAAREKCSPSVNYRTDAAANERLSDIFRFGGAPITIKINGTAVPGSAVLNGEDPNKTFLLHPHRVRTRAVQPLPKELLSQSSSRPWMASVIARINIMWQRAPSPAWCGFYQHNIRSHAAGAEWLAGGEWKNSGFPVGRSRPFFL